MRKMIEQGGNHLFDPYRNSTAPCIYYQYIFLQIAYIAGVGALRGKGRHKHTLQTPKTGRMLLKPGKRRVASKVAM